MNLSITGATNGAGDPVSLPLPFTLSSPPIDDSSGGQASGAATIGVAPKTPDDYYTLTVQGVDKNNSAITATTTITVTVQANYGLLAAPEEIPCVGGGTATSTISVQPGQGFADTVTFAAPAVSLSGAPSTDITATLSAPSIAVAAGETPPTSTLTVTAPSGLPSNTYIVYLTGEDSNGNGTSCSVEVDVQSASFTIAANPSWLGVDAGDTTGDFSDIAVTPVGAFTGPVTLSVQSVTDPNGNLVGGSDATGATAPCPIAWAFLSSLGGATSAGVGVPGDPTLVPTDTLNVTASATAAQGYYTITLQGADGATPPNTTTTQIGVLVDAGFVLDALPEDLTIAPGSSDTSAITAWSTGDATGALVTLTATVYDAEMNQVTDTSIVTASLGSSTIGVGDESQSMLTVTVGPNAPRGATYSVDVTGTDGLK